MTAPTSTVVSVVTTDKDPATPKYRISAKPTEDTAIVTLRIDPGNTALRPGVNVRPGAGVKPRDGTFDIGNALVGDILPGMAPFLGAWLITKGPKPTSTPVVGALGAVCGISRCGGPGVKPLHVEITYHEGVRLVPTIVEGVSFGEFKGTLAEGDNTINVFALVEPEGWI